MSVVTATILSAGSAIDPTYELVSIAIVKEINRIPSAQLILIDGDVAQQSYAISNDTVFEPGKEIEIKLRYEGETEDVTVFKGLSGGLSSRCSGTEADGERSDSLLVQQTDRNHVSN